MGSQVAKATLEAIKLLKRMGITTTPVPVDKIAERLNAHLAFEPFDGDVSGFLARRAGKRALIGVNSAHPDARQRFTIAHEIGHLLLHDGRPLIVDKMVRVNLRASSLPSEPIETAANKFAAALLMPADSVRREFARVVPKEKPAKVDEIVDTLAASFAVSPQTMRIRLNELDLLSEMSLY